MGRFSKYLVASMLVSGSFVAWHATYSQTASKSLGAAANVRMAALRGATPFQNSDGSVPPPGMTTFTLSHDWPTAPLPPITNAPWRTAIGNGLITTKNAPAYAEALKAAVATNARALIAQGSGFDAAAAGWYNEPWVGSLRDPLQGTYCAGAFGPSFFPNTGLRASFDTRVLTYYDKRAAASLYSVWGKTAMRPNVQTANFQFAEGAIVVKAALFQSIDPNQPTGWWDAMTGAQQWNMFIPIDCNADVPAAPTVVPGYIAQFDIVVKDSQSAPKTGWVFMTLVYDSTRPGDIWDKMVPLGAQWGNDPQATSSTATLTENWINPAAPLYATQTLGFGGRLSGPNDGATNAIAVNGKVLPNAPDSGCMSCHSTSQWNAANHAFPTFLLPSFPPPKGQSNPPFLACGNDGKPVKGGAPNICSPAPGSALWMKWFQNRLGTQAMDAGATATDFDEVFAFKSLPLWWSAVGPKNQPMPMLTRIQFTGRRTNQYSGAPARE
ncbi:hypothetical protein [Sphingomonas sp.]|jgi:hypothetical protein|uniref:hypothetical protein n=1 Tax=Sphingomonas sp. TaxID=28214 RepID=UPI002E33D054|nr:hypothetical protein [Sphingomonas sp.]HEX4693993.1 hypothetical protein [Sphingomonas sp.]